MPNFHYTALDQNGQETAGVIEAPNEADAVGQLRRGQLYPTQVVEEGRGDTSKIKRAAVH